MFKRGQEIETIWAFSMALIIITATVAVLVSTNILSPKQYIEPSCSISPRIKCTDYKINTTGHGTLKIENDLGEDILNVILKVGDCDEVSTTIIRNQRGRYLNFQNCGIFPVNQRIDKKIDVKYQVFGNSFIFDLSGNLLTDIESGLTWVFEEIILPIIKQILVAPECTYLTQDFSNYVASVGRDDAATWKTTDTFYVKDPATQNLVTFGIDCVIPYSTRVTTPAYCDLTESGFDRVYTETQASQTYASGSPAGVLGCCSKGINPVRGDIKTFRVGENGYSSFDAKDTFIDQQHPSSGNGAELVLEVKKNPTTTNHTIFGWDISSIPSTAKVRNATIMLKTTGYTGRVQCGQITLYKLVTTGWTAGATWNIKNGFLSPWNNGAFSIQDYDSGAPLKTITIPSTCTNTKFNITGTNLVSYAQSKVGTTTFDLVLIHDTDNTPLQMHSSRAITITDRPKLFIEYEDKLGGQHFCPDVSTTTSSTTTTTVLGNLDNQETTPEYELIQEYPASFGNIVVWQQYDINKNNYDIFLCNITRNGQNEGCLAGDAKRQVTSIAGNQTRPAIYGNRIIWEDTTSASLYTSDIYMCDLTLASGTSGACYAGDTKTALFTLAGSDSKPRIWGNSTAQTKIVWQRGESIYLCKFADNGGANCNTYTVVTAPTTDTRCFVGSRCAMYNPDIHGNIVVWETHYNDVDGEHSEIYRCDASLSSGTSGACTPTNRIGVTSAGYDYTPKVHGNIMVWRTSTNQIRRCSIACTAADAKTSVTDSLSDYQSAKRNPEIYGYQIAWAQQLPGQSIGHFDIYKCSINTTGGINAGCTNGNNMVQVTSDLDDQLNPEIYARFVIWQDYRNVNADIYMSNKSKLS